MNHRGVTGTRNLNMTDAHRVGLQQLKDRDAKIVSFHYVLFSMNHGLHFLESIRLIDIS